MIMVYLIQACLFMIGAIPFICEMSKHFKDSCAITIARTTLFIMTLVCGYYAPNLKSLPTMLLSLLTIFVIYISFQTMKDVMITYHNKKFKRINNDN